MSCSVLCLLHVLCSKDIKIISLVLFHFWNKVILEKLENDVPVASRNNESKVICLGSFTVKVSDFYGSFLSSLARLLSWFSVFGLLGPEKSM